MTLQIASFAFSTLEDVLSCMALDLPAMPGALIKPLERRQYLQTTQCKTTIPSRAGKTLEQNAFCSRLLFRAVFGVVK